MRWGVFHHECGGRLVFAGVGHVLRRAGDDQQNRSEDADRLVVRDDRHQQHAAAHDEQREREHLTAPQPVGERGEQHGGDRTHHEADADHDGIGVEQRDRRVAGREELSGKDRREKRMQGGVEELDAVADHSSREGFSRCFHRRPPVGRPCTDIAK